MSETVSESTGSVTTIRWVARILGALFIAVFLILVVGDFIEKGTMPVQSDRMPSMAFLLLAFIGLIIAWKWEGAGGSLALGSMIVYTILGLKTEVKPAAILLLTGIFSLPALLFLFCWWKTRKHDHSK